MLTISGKIFILAINSCHAPNMMQVTKTFTLFSLIDKNNFKNRFSKYTAKTVRRI
jgi:hypothetical protein